MIEFEFNGNVSNRKMGHSVSVNLFLLLRKDTHHDSLTIIAENCNRNNIELFADFIQRLIQIADYVFDVFDSNRDSHQAIGDSETVSLSVRY